MKYPMSELYEQNVLLDGRRLANYFLSPPPHARGIELNGSPALLS